MRHHHPAPAREPGGVTAIVVMAIITGLAASAASGAPEGETSPGHSYTVTLNRRTGGEKPLRDGLVAIVELSERSGREYVGRVSIRGEPGASPPFQALVSGHYSVRSRWSQLTIRRRSGTSAGLDPDDPLNWLLPALVASRHVETDGSLVRPSYVRLLDRRFSVAATREPAGLIFRDQGTESIEIRLRPANDSTTASPRIESATMSRKELSWNFAPAR